MRGKALVQLQGRFDNEGSIVLPEVVKTRRKCEARLLAYTHDKESRRLRYIDDALMSEKAVVILLPYAGTEMFSHDGFDNLCIIRITDIVAWSPESLALDQSRDADGAVPRCHFCGPAVASKSSNAMLMVEGPNGYYCPRCMKDTNGIVADPDEITLSKAEEEQIENALRHQPFTKRLF